MAPFTGRLRVSAACGTDLLEASGYGPDDNEEKDHHSERDDLFFWPFHVPEKPQKKLLYLIK